jgi:HEAT repeat protein
MYNLGDAAQAAALVITNCLNPTNNPQIQLTAVVALGNLKACPQVSVPALISTLKSADPTIRNFSAMCLANFGSRASNAIPALTNALTDSDIGTRDMATQALHIIDPARFPNNRAP